MNPLTIPRTTRDDHLSIRRRTDHSWPDDHRRAFMTGYGSDPGAIAEHRIGLPAGVVPGSAA